MKMHDAVQKVIDIATAADDGDFSREKFDAAFEEAWVSHGPAEHGYAKEYKEIALGLIGFLKESTNGYTVQRRPQLRLPVLGGEVVITPDQVVSDPSGQVIMRKVRTGHKQDKEEETVAAAAFHLAASTHTPGCTVELVHLSDGIRTPIRMSARVLSNRQASLTEMAESVRAGRFPLTKDEKPCPRCPAFFVCGRLPSGPLVKKFPA